MNKIIILPAVILLGFHGIYSNDINFYTERNAAREINVYRKDNFKKWLRDTLLVIRKLPLSSELGLKQIKLNIGNDSSSLEILKTFEMVLDPAEELARPGKVKSVVALLKVNSEYPSNKFAISFITRNYFYPSLLNSFNYESLFEVKQLTVLQSGTKTTYGYFRGGITDKQVIRKNKSGKAQIEKYDFIWEGKSLTKKRL